MKKITNDSLCNSISRILFHIFLSLLLVACSEEKSNENIGGNLLVEKLNLDSIVVINQNSNETPISYLMNWETMKDVPNKWISYSAKKKDTTSFPRFELGDFGDPKGVTTIEYEDGLKSYIDIFKAVTYKSKMEFEITGYELESDIRIYAKVKDSIMNTVAFDIESEKHGNYHWMMIPTSNVSEPKGTPTRAQF